MKKNLPMDAAIVMCVCIAIVFAVCAIIFPLLHINTADTPPETGIAGENAAFREKTISFVRENEELLRGLMLPGSNPEAAIKDTILASVHPAGEICFFDTDLSHGGALASLEYRILYSESDPRHALRTFNDVPWEAFENGWLQDNSTIAYLEEIGNGFYYFFLNDA